MSDWISGHVHFEGGSIYDAPCDRIVLDVVAPIARHCLDARWATQFFFVRYREHGPHVRLRLRASIGCDADAIVGFFDGQVAANEGLSLCWVPYEAEIARYGGPSAMPVVERAFHASSELAIALLRHRDGSTTRGRLGRALMAMTVTLHIFLPDRAAAARLLEAYSTGYRRAMAGSDDELLASAFRGAYESQRRQLLAYVDEIWDRLTRGESVTPALDAYATRMCGIRDALRALHQDGVLEVAGSKGYGWDECTMALLPSLTHMTNNRLGVPVVDEAYLAHLIGTCLVGDPGDDAALGPHALP